MKQQHRIVVHQHRPWLRPLLVAGITGMLVVGAVLIFSVTRKLTASDYKETKSELEQIRDEERGLRNDLRAERKNSEQLKQDLVYAQQSADIEKQACSDVRSSLEKLQNQSADLREQVAFYRGIVSPDEAQTGFRVMEMHATPMDKPRQWNLDLVLVQSSRKDKKVDGQIKGELAGLDAKGKVQTLNLEQVLLSDDKTVAFSFKYFEELSIQVGLPEGFRPLRVNVSLMPQDKSLTQVDEAFEWANILNQQQEDTE